MELRVLEYFLAVAREQNISRAAEFLHLSQPTLSRQLKDLEEELGKQLLIRGNRKVTLTKDGMFLRKRAEEIVSLSQRTIREMQNTDENIVGDIYIGSGESASIRNILKVAKEIQKDHPGIYFHIISGDSKDLTDRLDKGLFDFAILFGDFDRAKYEYIALPYQEKWGVLMRKDSPLADKEFITKEDLENLPLILSRQSIGTSSFSKWFGRKPEELSIVGTYNLIYNASIMADEGMGYVLTLKDLLNTEGTNLCFKELEGMPPIPLSIVWKKYQALSKGADRFIQSIAAVCNDSSHS